MVMEETKIKDVIVLREYMKSKDAFPAANPFNGDMIYDYLTIYNQGGEILSRSIGYAPNVEITMFYKGLQFICKPGYTEDSISIGWQSLIEFINKEE